MKENDDLLRAQINDLIRDEIQEGINDWIEEKDVKESTGLGFAKKTAADVGDELKVNIPQAEIDKLLKEYKKIKRRQKSNLFQAKKLFGLVDEHGIPLGDRDVEQGQSLETDGNLLQDKTGSESNSD